MNQEQAMLMMLKGVLSEVPSETKAKVEAAADELRQVAAKYGDEGLVALSLVGLEKSVEAGS